MYSWSSTAWSTDLLRASWRDIFLSSSMVILQEVFRAREECSREDTVLQESEYHGIRSQENTRVGRKLMLSSHVDSQEFIMRCITWFEDAL